MKTPISSCRTTRWSALRAATTLYYDGKGLARFPDKPIVEGTMVYSADYPYRGPKKLILGRAGLVSTPWTMPASAR